MSDTSSPTSVIRKLQPRHRRWCRSRTSAARAQQGIATVLMALLVGAAVMVSTFGIVQYVRANQDQSVTVHAQTQAQMNAWTGVELLRKYIESLSATQLTTLVSVVNAAAGSTTITFPSDLGISAVLLKTSSATRIQAQVTGTTGAGTLRSKATATLGVTYGVIAAQSEVLTNVFTMGGGINLSLQNGTSLITAQDSQAVINVDGDVSTVGSDYTITGVKTINSTGNIALLGTGTVTTLNSNCDVRLEGTVSVTTVNATRDFCSTMTGQGLVGTANINGSAIISNDARYTTLNILGNTQGTSCNNPDNAVNRQTCDVANPSITNYKQNYALYMGYSGNPNVTNAKVDAAGGGNVGMGNGASIADLAATGVLSILGGRTLNVSGYAYNGTSGAINGTVRTKNSTPAPPATLSLTKAGPVTINAGAPFDARAYRGKANFAFYVASGVARVDVTNVNGTSNVTGYFLKTHDDIGNLNGSYACASADCNGAMINLCSASVQTACISYGGGVWTVSGNNSNSLVRGVLWFDGNLIFRDGGAYYDTFLATGNITTNNGQPKIYSLNYIGLNGLDGNNNPLVGVPVGGACLNTNPATTIISFPTNFCGTNPPSFNAYAASGVGNYALIAGSFGVDENGASVYSAANYVGGNISLQGSPTIYGYLLAGNVVTDSGGGSVINIYGYINSKTLGNNANGTAISSLRSTTIDVSHLPTTMAGVGLTAGNAVDPTGGNPQQASGTTATVLYSRYL